MKKMLSQYKKDIAEIERRLMGLLMMRTQATAEQREALDKRIDLLRCERWEMRASVRSMEDYLRLTSRYPLSAEERRED